MGRYVIRRFMVAIPTLLGVTGLIFVLVRVLPGDPAVVMLGDYATPELVESLRHELGLDKPVPLQYLDYLTQLLSGDLGTSIRNDRPVGDQIAHVLPFTLQLTASAMVLSAILGVGAGVLAAIRRDTWLDSTAMVAAMTGYSMPAFWLGILLLLVFSVELRWFAVLGAGEGQGVVEQIKHLILPMLAVGLRQAGLIARMTRSRLVEILTEDYIRTAWAKGLAERRVILAHAMKNAAIPIITVIGNSTGQLLGGALVTEIVFTRPGLGRLMVEAVFTRDYTMIQGVVLIWAVGLILVNLLVDVSYAYLDPRIRFG